MVKLTNAATEVTWHAESRTAGVRYVDGANLTFADARFLVDALTGWVGADPKPFGVLADASGLGRIDADYRMTCGGYFRQNQAVAFIALYNMSAAIRVLTEMFRLGTGVQLKGFSHERDARAWLKEKGFGL